jgi:hypothetical protein
MAPGKIYVSTVLYSLAFALVLGLLPELLEALETLLLALLLRLSSPLVSPLLQLLQAYQQLLLPALPELLLWKSQIAFNLCGKQHQPWNL